jgi:peroxiredoxin
MFCKQQVAQLRGVVGRIRDKGAELVVIGNGSPAEAAEFREAQKVDFPLLTDPERASYKAAGLKRGLSLSGRMALNAIKALAGGHIQTRTKGSAGQLGGAFVFARGGALRFSFFSEEAGHHPDPEDLLRALP